jgi:hypothetical protein
MRSARRSMCAAMLSMQAVVLGLTTPVLISIADVPVATSLGVGLGLAALCLVAAALLRLRAGYWLGWAVQAGSLALGVVITMMFFLGAVFAALWVAAYLLGGRLDRERAERAVLEEPGRSESAG